MTIRVSLTMFIFACTLPEVGSQMRLAQSVVVYESTQRAGEQVLTIQGRDGFGNALPQGLNGPAPTDIQVWVCRQIVPTSTPTTLSRDGTELAEVQSNVTTNAPTALHSAAPVKSLEDPPAAEGPLCQSPLMGQVQNVASGEYVVTLRILSVGSFHVYVSSGADLLSEYPAPLTVMPSLSMGDRSFLRLSTTLWFAGMSPAEFELVGVDVYGNAMTTGAHANSVLVTTSPVTRDEAGNSPGAVEVIDLNNGTYKIRLFSVLAATFYVHISIHGQELAGGPRPVTIRARELSVQTTADYLTSARAGERNSFLVHARDKYGNLIPYEDYTAAFSMDTFIGSARFDSNPVFKKVAFGTYSATFSAPTDIRTRAGIQIILTDLRYGLDRSPIEGSQFLVFVEIVNSVASVRTSEFYVEGVQRAGEVVYGILPFDKYGHPCTFGLPNPFSVVAVFGTDRISGQGVNERYRGIPGTETVPVYQATTQGVYTLYLYLGGILVDLSGVSPVNVTVVPGHISKTSDVEYVGDVLPIGVQSTLSITGRDMYGNLLSQGGEAALIGVQIHNPTDSNEMLDSKVMDTFDGKYRIQFTPAKSGRYHILVSFPDGLHGRRIIFSVQGVSATPSMYSVSGSALDGATAGQDSEVYIRPLIFVRPDLDAAAEFNATLTFNGITETLAIQRLGSSSDRRITINKTVSGNYRLDIFLGQTALALSPYSIVIAGGNPVNSTSLMLARDLGPGPLVRYSAGENAVMYVQSRDVYGNVPSIEYRMDIVVAYSKQPENTVNLADVVRQTNDSITDRYGMQYAFVTFANLTIAGTYSVQVHFQGQPQCIAGLDTGLDICIPDFIIVPERSLASMSLVLGSGTQDFRAGSSVQLKVIPLDRFGNQASYLHSASELVYLLSAWHVASDRTVVLEGLVLHYVPQDNSHEVVYTLTIAGNYEVGVDMIQPRWYQESTYFVSGKPLDIRVHAAEAHLPHTEVATYDFVAGAALNFSISFKDKYANCVMHNLTKDVHVILQSSEGTASPYPAFISRQINGSYRADFSIVLAGSYLVDVVLHGKTALSSVFRVHAAEPTGAMSSAWGAGLHQATAGDNMTFQIQPHDRYANRLYEPGGEFVVNASLALGAGIANSILQLEPEHFLMHWSRGAAAYQVVYMMEVSGTLAIGVTCGPPSGGDHVQSSPFFVPVVGAYPSAQMTRLRGPGLEGAAVNTTTTFLIEARDRFSNRLSAGGHPFKISARPETLGTAAKMSMWLRDNHDGTYAVEYSANLAANYVVSLVLNQDLAGFQPYKSPFLLTVRENAGQLSISQSSAEGPNLFEAYAGVSSTYTISLVSFHGIPLSKSAGIAFDVSFTCETTDDTCPFPTRMLTLENVVRTYGMDTVGNRVIDNNNGTYEVQFSIPRKGRYLHSVTVDNTYIAVPSMEPGWPLYFVVHAAETSPAHSHFDPSLLVPSIIQAGAPVHFRIFAYDAMENRQDYSLGTLRNDDFVVSATFQNLQVGDVRQELDASEGAYNVWVTLSHPGMHTINVTLRGQIIGTAYTQNGASFSVDVQAGILSPAKTQIAATWLQSSEVGRAAMVWITAYDTLGNQLSRSQLLEVECRAEISAAVPTLQPSIVALSCNAPGTGDASFVIGYNLTRAGLFSLRVYLNAESAGLSPNMQIMPGPSSESTTTVANGVLNAGVASMEMATLVIARDVFGNSLSIGGDVIVFEVLNVRTDPGSQQVFGTVTDNMDGTYMIKYTVYNAGNYSVLISINGKPLSTNPLDLEVRPATTDPQQSFIQDGAWTHMIAGQVSIATIVPVTEVGLRQDSEVLDDWAVSISPMGEGLGEVLGVTRSPDGSYQVAVKAKQVLFFADGLVRPYHIDISLNNVLLLGSPFQAFVASAEAHASTSIMYSSSGSAAAASDFSSIAGEGSEVQLQLRDVFGNDVTRTPFGRPVTLEAHLAGLSNVVESGIGSAAGVVALCIFTDSTMGPYLIFCNATIAGGYHFHLSINGLQCDPVMDIRIRPSYINPRMFLLRGSGITESVKPFDSVYFSVQCRDSFGNYLESDGSLAYVNPMAYLRVHIELHTGSVLTNNAQRIVLQSVDILAVPSSPNASEFTDGTYLVRFRTLVSGGRLVTRLTCVQGFSETEVGDSPYSVAAVATTATTAEMYGPVLSGSTAIVKSTAPPSTPYVYVYLVPRDKALNDARLPDDTGMNGNFSIHVYPEGSAYIEQPVLGPSGVYEGRFRCWEEGLITVEAKYQGKHVVNSPKVLLVRPEFSFVNPVYSYAEGAGLVSAVVGQPASFTVHLITDSSELYPLSKNNPCQCEICPSSVGTLEHFVQVYINAGILDDSLYTENGIIDNCNGTYTVQYTVETVGRHAIEVFVGVEDGNPNFGSIPELLGGGPPYFSIAYASPTVGASIRYLASANTGAATSGEEVMLDILPVDRYGNRQDYAVSPMDEFCVNVTANQLQTIQAAMVAKRNNSAVPVGVFFRAYFTPKDVGVLEIDVFLRNNHTQMQWKPVARTKLLNVSTGDASVDTTTVSGEGVRHSSAGAMSYVRIQVRDRNRNVVNTTHGLLAHLLPANDHVSVVGLQLLPVTHHSLREFVYSATVTGTYTLQVFIQGSIVSIPDYISTVITAGPVDATTSFCRGIGVGEGIKHLVVRHEAEFIIFTRDRYGNRRSRGGAAFFTVLKSAMDVSPGYEDFLDASKWAPNNRWFVHPLVVDRDDGTYRVNYTPEHVAVYLVSVEYAGSSLSGSPYLVNVQSDATDASKTTIFCREGTPCGLANVQAGMRATLFVQARDRWENNKTDSMDVFVYSVVGIDGYNELGMARPLGSKNPGLYDINYNTEIAGFIQILISHRSAPIFESAVVIVPASLDVLRCTLDGPGMPITTAGKVQELVLTARDTFSNRLLSGGLQVRAVISASAVKVPQSEIGFVDLGDGTYKGYMQRTEAANYTVQANIADMDLIPAWIYVQASRLVLGNTLVEPVSENLHTSFVAGEESILAFTFRDEFLNVRMHGCDLIPDVARAQHEVTSLSLVVYSQKDGSTDEDLLASTITFVSDPTNDAFGKYIVRFNSTRAGILRVFAMVGGYSLFNASSKKPFQLLVSPGPASALHSVLYVPGGAAMGETTSCTVEAYDAFSNALAQDTAKFRVRFWVDDPSDSQLQDDVRMVTSSFVFRESRVYFAAFTPPSNAFAYQLNVEVCLMERVGNQTRDQALPVVGRVHVRRQGEAAASSNSMIHLSNGLPVNASFMPLSGFAGADISFYVQAYDRYDVATGMDIGGNVLDLSWLSVDVAPEPSYVAASLETLPGKYRVTFNTFHAGIYSVLLEVGGASISGNWEIGDIESGQMLIQVRPGASSSRQALVTRLHSAAVAGVRSQFKIVSYDLYGNRQVYDPFYGQDDYKATLYHVQEASFTQDLELMDNMDGSYLMAFRVTKAGVYALVMTLEDVPLDAISSEFKITVRAGEVFAPSCILYPSSSGLLSAQVGEPVRFVVEPRDAYGNPLFDGKSQFEANVASQEGQTGLPLTLNSNGTFSVMWIPLQNGRHTLSINVAQGGRLVVPPWDVKVTPGTVLPSLSLVGGNGIHGGSVNEMLFVYVLFRDSYRNIVQKQADEVSMMIFSENSASPLYMLEQYEEPSGRILANYSLNDIGHYELRIWMNALELPQSPFQVIITPSQAPRMKGAYLAASLNRIDIVFDSNIENHFFSQGTGLCSQILSEDTVRRLGSRPVCVWSADSTFTVFLGSNSTVYVAHRITLQGGAVCKKAESSYAASGAISVTLSEDVSPPTAILSAPSVIGPCSSLRLDASTSFGGGRQAMQFEFGVEAINGDPARIKLRLKEAVERSQLLGDPSIVVMLDLDFDADCSYVFQVVVKSAFGLSAATQVVVFYSRFPVPTAFISGERFRQVYKRTAVNLHGVTSLAEQTCRNGLLLQDRLMFFEWAQTDGPPLVGADFTSVHEQSLYQRSAFTSNLHIPANSLHVGKVYIFNLSVSIAGNPMLSSTTAVSLEVLASPLKPFLLGGNKTVWRNSRVELVVHAGDPDNTDATTHYLWSCKTSTLSHMWCFEPGSVPAQMYTNADRLFIPAGWLMPGDCIFTVEIYKEPITSGRRVFLSTTITILNQDSEQNMNLDILSALPSKITPRSVFSLKGHAEGNTIWRCSVGHLSRGGLLEESALAPLSGEYLLLPSSALLGGQTYSFELSGTTALNVRLRAHITITANEPPWGGRLTLNPLQGIEAETRFTVQMVGWTDLQSDMPLQYSLFYELASESYNTLHILAALQSSHTFEVFLPSGEVRIEARIYDAYGAFTRVWTSQVYVTSSTRLRRLQDQVLNTAVKAANFVDSRLFPLMEIMGTSQALQIVDIYGREFGGGVIDVDSACSNSGNELAVVHELVLQQLSHIRQMTPMSSELLMQLHCVSHPLLRNASFVSAGSIDLVLTGLELDMALLIANSEVGLLDGAGTCTAELLSNVLAVLLTACYNHDEARMFRLRTQISAFLEIVTDNLYPGMLPVQYEMKRFAMELIKVGHLEFAHVSAQNNAATMFIPQGVTHPVLVGILCFQDGIQVLPLSLQGQEAEILSDLCLLQVGTHLTVNALKIQNVSLAMTYDPFLARKSSTNQGLLAVHWWQEGQQQWTSAGMITAYANQLVVNSVFRSIPLGPMYIAVMYINDTNVAPVPSSPCPPNWVNTQPPIPPLTPRVPQPSPPPTISGNTTMFSGPMLEVIIAGVAAAVATGFVVWWKCRPAATRKEAVAVREENQNHSAADLFDSRFDPFSAEAATVNDKSDNSCNFAHMHLSSPQDDENFVWEGRGGGGCPPSSRVLATHVPGHIRPKNSI